MADEILMLGFERFAAAPLPAGAGVPRQYPYPGVAEIAVLPSGRVLGAVTTSFPNPRIALEEVLPAGTLRRIGLVDPPPFAYTEERIEDLAVDNRGRLYLLTQALRPGPVGPLTRLIELDPATGATLGWKEIRGGVHTLAAAPQGFYAYDGVLLSPLDPDNGAFGAPLLLVPIDVYVSEIAADSGGKIWMLARPVCETGGESTCLYSLDLETGQVQQAPAAMYEPAGYLFDIAIKRRCIESETVRCLQEGRFRAEIEFSDYAGAAGTARSAEARSSDTGVFSFFDEDNWELMVKVLDGCGINSRFWVYAAASTDVAYTLTLTDTGTGAQQVYRNTLGQVAATVTDNQAFACSESDLAAAAVRSSQPILQQVVAEPASPAAAGSGLRYDELWAVGPPGLLRAPLPAGPAMRSPSRTLFGIQALADGRVVAVSPVEGGRLMLSELRDDAFVDIGLIGVPGEAPLALGVILDLALDADGFLWALGPEEPNPPHLKTLLKIDPATGAVLHRWIAWFEIDSLAGAPRGLWAATSTAIYRLDTEFFGLSGPVVELTGFDDIGALDADSAGRLYFTAGVSTCQDCSRIGVYDPETGSVATAPVGLPPGLYDDLTIRRRCVDSPTGRCLSGGRFHAEVAYRGFDGASGAAQVAPARSADTGIFSFFDPDNWEQMVKVLDGCGLNSHFWVYAAASTDVAYELKVTDIETGAVKTYTNPLGQVALTVTDNLAFSCGSHP